MEVVACTIRRAAQSDAGPLADLAARTFRVTFEASTSPEDMDAHLAGSYGPALQLAEIASPEITTLLADCGVLAAFAQLRCGPSPSCVTAARPVEVWRFYVDQPWHGRGIAQRLMQAAIDEAALMGATAVWLGVWENNARAIAFYGKLGFVDVGSHEFLVGNDPQTDRVMVRRLGASKQAG
jgi:ribosomal protein S18 acetylase RimI-like enzyme